VNLKYHTDLVIFGDAEIFPHKKKTFLEELFSARKMKNLLKFLWNILFVTLNGILEIYLFIYLFLGRNVPKLPP